MKHFFTSFKGFSALFFLFIFARFGVGDFSSLEFLIWILIALLGYHFTRPSIINSVVKPRIGITLGDINGIGLEIALRSHALICGICQPIYYGNKYAISSGLSLLNINLEDDFFIVDCGEDTKVQAGIIDARSGKNSYMSFEKAVNDALKDEIAAVVTMPIHKKAWEKGGILFKGHTDALRSLTGQEAIMVLGCEKMWIALFTEHCPLKEVPAHLTKEALIRFLTLLEQDIPYDEPIGVLGLNPHAGDNGVLGDEERIIEEVITTLNSHYGTLRFIGPLVPDVAFTPQNRQKFRWFVAMYHDQGLGPLKALYFDEGINMSLGLPLIRTSVDHGTAFDKAYTNTALSTKSYENAIKEAVKKAKSKKNSGRILVP